MGGNKEINGQKCPYSHPRRCKRFCSFGPRGRGGCNRGNECVLHHPKLCNNSLRNSTCFNENCIFVHLKGTKRSRPSRDHSHVRDPHHHSSRDRNPRARYTSQSRAEHPRRDPSPHSGHPHQSTDRRGSRPQTPANYPPRQHDRSPIPAAPVSNNSSEVPFFIIENASEHEARLPAGPLGHTTEHSTPTISEDSTSLSGTSTASLRPSFSTHLDNSTVPSLHHQVNPSAPLWMQNTPQFYC